MLTDDMLHPQEWQAICMFAKGSSCFRLSCTTSDSTEGTGPLRGQAAGFIPFSVSRARSRAISSSLLFAAADLKSLANDLIRLLTLKRACCAFSRYKLKQTVYSASYAQLQFDESHLRPIMRVLSGTGMALLVTAVRDRFRSEELSVGAAFLFFGVLDWSADHERGSAGGAKELAGS